MAITPNTVVHFLNVPLENNYKNQIDFTDRSAQTAYMISKKIDDLSFENLTFQRKDNVIRVPKHIDSLWDVNYVMYQNADHNNRWFYAFVTKMEYINDGRTDVYIETDVWQTWFDRITLKPSFVEREHVEDDTPGLHTVPELLETGDYICNSNLDHDFNGKDEEMFIVVGTTQTYESKEKGGLYGGCYSGVHYLAWKVSEYEAVNGFLNYMDENAHAEAIQCVFMAPKFLIEYVAENGEENKAISNGKTVANQTEKVIIKNTLEGSGSNIDGYFPSNNKLWCYPYNYLLVSNNVGNGAIYQYEYFKTTREGFEHDCLFDIYGTLCPGGSIKLVPKDYKGVTLNYDEALNLGKFPICNWNSDVYTNWLTQNAMNIGVDIMGSANQILTGAALTAASGGALGILGGISTMYSGYIGIAGSMAQVVQHSMIPPQALGNLNSGDVLQGKNKITFSFYKMSIKKEFAKIIDGFFEKFGYRVNTVKTPKIRTRPHWNYIKTIDVNLDGRIPQDDLTKVRAMFDNGITFWHDGNNVENYSLNNH